MSTRAFFSCQPILFGSRWLLLALALWASAAHADDYADVSRLTDARQYPQALAKADATLSANPRDPQMRFLKGVIQTQTGLRNDAIATFTALTADYPELPEPYNNLAALYAHQGQLDKARQALDMAVRLNPGYAIAHENLGDIYLQLANQAYSKALQLKPDTPSLTPKLALIHQLQTPAAAP